MDVILMQVLESVRSDVRRLDAFSHEKQTTSTNRVEADDDPYSIAFVCAMVA